MTSYIALDSTISVIPTAWSISWWMLMGSHTWSTIFSKAVTGTTGYVGTNAVIDKIAFRSQDNSDYFSGMTTGLANMGDDEWHHYVITSGTGDFKLYTDGVNTWSNGSALTDTTNQLFQYFGAAQDTGHPQEFTNGNLDEVRFYNKELSSANVTSLYEATDSHTGYTWAFMCPRLFSEPIKFGGGSGVKTIHYDSGDLE